MRLFRFEEVQEHYKKADPGEKVQFLHYNGEVRDVNVIDRKVNGNGVILVTLQETIVSDPIEITQDEQGELQAIPGEVKSSWWQKMFGR